MSSLFTQCINVGLLISKVSKVFSSSLFLVLLYFLLNVKNNLQNGGIVIIVLLIICNDERTLFFLGENFLQTTFVLCLSLVFVNIQLEKFFFFNLINYVCGVFYPTSLLSSLGSQARKVLFLGPEYGSPGFSPQAKGFAL